ncbi:MAG TPA: mandelate racemase/muconate lactonizing enzyme family protein [Acidimicrobiales bacterium]|jgi:D-galactarolactone cycloisomerase|nr:mandelate racemase/muconate lactonizing enzyme family protein [Acidimicrobiales bacterium]
MTAAPKIASVTPIACTYPFEREPLSFCFVRIRTEDGLDGYGEVCDSFGCSYAGVVAKVIEDAYAPLLEGEVLEAVEPLADRLRLSTRRRLGDQWVATQARSGVEIALWDLLGKATGRSVSGIIGRVRDRVEVYASHPFLEEGSATWHAGMLAPLLERGVRRAKVRIGPDWRADLETLAELRALLDPAIELMVDGSESFTLPTALEIADRLASLGVTWFEEPVPQSARAAIEQLAERSPVAIAYGEHLFGREDALDALRHRQLSVLQPDASTSGGIGEARQMAELAAYFGARVVLHHAAGPVSLAANLQLAATVPSIRCIEYSYALAEGWSLGIGARLGPEEIVDGELPIPDAPGLGVDLDEEAASRFPYERPGRRVTGSRAGLPDRFVGDR